MSIKHRSQSRSWHIKGGKRTMRTDKRLKQKSRDDKEDEMI